MADGGATYTVNIELATRQFSQDLRNLKNKIQNELGKSVKVATGGTGGGTVSREKARAIRERRQQEAEDRRKAYSRDKKNAQQARTGDLIKQVNRLESYGFKVASKRAKIEEAHELAKKRDFQTADVRIKQLEAEIQSENKILDTIIKQGLEKEKQAKQRVEQARKLENRQRKGPHGQRMYGPIDELGNPIYTGKGPKPPAIPKSGASLPIDLGRKGTGTFATKQTELLRRRETLETLLATFKGVNTEEVRKFKTGIQTLITEYSKVSDLRTKMRPTGMGGKAMEGWGAWKDDKLITKDKIGNAGTISRQLEQLDNLTKREEFRGKQIRLRIRAEEEFLNKKHRIEKLLANFDKKGVATDAKRLKLEKAITVQDKQQLDTLLREIELENIGLKGVSGTGGGRGGRGGRGRTLVGGPSSPLNFAANGQLLAGPKPNAWGRIGAAAGISGGFPLLFGQSPAVAAISALGGGIGEAVTPGGGFAGGIVASALATKVAEAIQFRKEIDKVNKSIAATGGTSLFTSRGIEKLAKTLNMTKEEALNAAKSFAAFDASVRKSLLIAFGDEGTFNMVKGLKTNADLLKNIQAAEGKIGREKANQLINLMKTEGSLKVQKKLQDAILESQKKSVTGSKDQVNAFDDFMGMGRTLGNKYMNLFGQGPGEGNATVTGEDIRDIRMEKLLGNSQEEAVRKLGEELDRAFKLELITNIAAVRDEIERLESPLFLLTKTAETVGNAFGESFKGIVKGSMTAQEALRNLFQRTADHFLDMAAKMIAKQIQMKILGIGLNWFAGADVRGAATDAGRSVSDMNKIMNGGLETVIGGNRAAGGPVSGGTPYVVGEKGPELFVPGSSGNIVPNDAMGGANVVVNVDASGSSVEGDEAQSRELGNMLAAAIQAELVRQKRPGGLLV